MDPLQQMLDLIEEEIEKEDGMFQGHKHMSIGRSVQVLDRNFVSFSNLFIYLYTGCILLFLVIQHQQVGICGFV